MDTDSIKKLLDKTQIDGITKQFFGIFTNTDQIQPDWTVMNDLCIPEIIIIKKTGLAQEIYNLHSFIEPRKKILSDGTLTNFEESEVKEETQIIGHIAHRHSTYQKSGYLNGSYFNECGNKFFQFIKTKDGWKINSLIWEDEK